MFCIKCGQKLLNGAVYCTKCGERICTEKIDVVNGLNGNIEDAVEERKKLQRKEYEKLRMNLSKARDDRTNTMGIVVTLASVSLLIAVIVWALFGGFDRMTTGGWTAFVLSLCASVGFFLGLIKVSVTYRSVITRLERQVAEMKDMM